MFHSSSGQSVRCLCLFVLTVLVSGIDPQERIGSCQPIKLNVTYYVNENEGVWFPQYRSYEDESFTKGDVYSCHTVLEKVFLGEDTPPRLESDSYYTVNGKAIKDEFGTSYYRTGQRGKLRTTVNIKGHGEYQVFNYILNLTPEYRVRYICTDFPETIPGVAAIYIETRKTFPKLRVIKEANKVLLDHGLKHELKKINQNGCTRPIHMDGYVNMITDEK